MKRLSPSSRLLHFVYYFPCILKEERGNILAGKLREIRFLFFSHCNIDNNNNNNNNWNWSLLILLCSLDFLFCFAGKISTQRNRPKMTSHIFCDSWDTLFLYVVKLFCEDLALVSLYNRFFINKWFVTLLLIECKTKANNNEKCLVHQNESFVNWFYGFVDNFYNPMLIWNPHLQNITL